MRAENFCRCPLLQRRGFLFGDVRSKLFDSPGNDDIGVFN